jgi:hypothetical protein
MFLLITVVMAISGTPAAYGHGLGRSFETIIGGYFIDIGSDQFIFEAGLPARFDFAIQSADSDVTPDPDFASVWVRFVTENNQAIFAGAIHGASFGPTAAVLTFPRAGEYILTARFQNADGPIGEEVSFPFRVEPALGDADGGGLRDLVIGAILGMAVAGAVVISMKRRT